MNIIDIMRTGPLIPVLTIEDPAHAVPLARALVAGGIRVVEITLRTAAALDAIAMITEQVEGAIVGVGTITRAHDFQHALNAGAKFAVSPGFTPELAQGARLTDMPFLPGVMTPSDVIASRAAGFRELKLFPAQQCGGIGMLKALAAPFPDVTFCPTGGITLETAPDFLALRNVECVGGSWVAPPEAVANGEWDKITELARTAVRNLSRD